MPLLAFALLFAADVPKLPPGWLPVNRLDDAPAWADVRKIDDKVHLYLPPGVEGVRGVFVCFVFHSADPRELARLWRFALVTVPWPFEFDLGHNDKRNGRFKFGHPAGDMGVLLAYLDAAAAATKRPELSSVPIVGWLGQNGAKLCGDLHARAPDRVLAWADSWYHQWPKQKAAAEVPLAAAWELNAKQRKADGAKDVEGQRTPPPDLSCFATTYGFGHGIYSKFNFFAAFLDRCIALRMPDEMPPPGKPVRLKAIDRAKGYVGDFGPVGEWNPVARHGEAKGFSSPTWLPDAYMASAWRAYHSAKPGLRLTSPAIEYRKKDGKWGGPECGLGYGAVLKPAAPLRFAAQATAGYAKVEFYDGDRLVGSADKAPYAAEGVKLPRGVRVLYAVGVKPDGTRAASRPAFVVVD